MKDFFNKKELLETIEPVIENTAMRYGLIPLEILFERENNRHFLRIFIFTFVPSRDMFYLGSFTSL